MSLSDFRSKDIQAALDDGLSGYPTDPSTEIRLVPRMSSGFFQRVPLVLTFAMGTEESWLDG